MLNCQALDSLVTPYIDGELTDDDRRAIADHLRACAPCYSRVAAERAVYDLIHVRKPALDAPRAPETLRAACADLAAQRRHDVLSPASPVARVPSLSDPFAASASWR